MDNVNDVYETGFYCWHIWSNSGLPMFKNVQSIVNIETEIKT